MPGVSGLYMGCCIPPNGSSQLWAAMSGPASTAAQSREGGISDSIEANYLGEIRLSGRSWSAVRMVLLPVSAYLVAS